MYSELIVTKIYQGERYSETRITDSFAWRPNEIHVGKVPTSTCHECLLQYGRVICFLVILLYVYAVGIVIYIMYCVLALFQSINLFLLLL